MPPLSVSVDGPEPREDEDTRLPYHFSLWEPSPLFPGAASSPCGYFDWLYQ